MTNSAMIERWNGEEGVQWAALQPRIDERLRPFGAAGIDALDVRAEQQVLDVGCGCGDTTLTLAERARAGSVVGVDVSGPMLSVARRRAAHLANASFVQADVQTAALDPTGFDRVFSRFGVMFFDDPVAAFANVAAACRPEARLCFVCWQGPERNPWVVVPSQAAASVVPDAPPLVGPGAPGPFAFGDSAHVSAILDRAGWEGVRLEPFETTQRFGDDLDGAVADIGWVGTVRRVLATAPPDAVEPALAAVRDALEPWVGADGSVALPAAAWVVTATRAQ